MWRNVAARCFKGKRRHGKTKRTQGGVSDAFCFSTAALGLSSTSSRRHLRIIQKRRSAARCRFYDDNISTVRQSRFCSSRRFEDK